MIDVITIIVLYHDEKDSCCCKYREWQEKEGYRGGERGYRERRGEERIRKKTKEEWRREGRKGEE